MARLTSQPSPPKSMSQTSHFSKLKFIALLPSPKNQIPFFGISAGYIGLPNKIPKDLVIFWHICGISKHLQGDEAFEFVSQLSSLADTSTQRSPGRVQHGDHHGVRIIQQCFPRTKIITQTPAIFLGDVGGAQNKALGGAKEIWRPMWSGCSTRSTFSVGNGDGLPQSFLPHPNPSLSSKSWPWCRIPEWGCDVKYHHHTPGIDSSLLFSFSLCAVPKEFTFEEYLPRPRCEIWMKPLPCLFLQSDDLN